MRKIMGDNYKGERQPPEVFCKKGVLRNFVKFTGTHMCQGLCFSKVACLKPANLLKKRPWYRCVPVNFAKFLRTRFLQNTPRRLLLKGTDEIGGNELIPLHLTV